MVHRAIRDIMLLYFATGYFAFAMSIFLTPLLMCSQQLLRYSHAVLQCSHKLIPMGASISCCGVLLTAAAVL